MKSSLKRAIGIFLMLIMAAGVFAPGCGGKWNGNASADKVELDIRLLNTEFKWGDELAFKVTAKNVSEEKLTNVRIEESAGGFSSVGSAQIDPAAAAELMPGAEAEFTIVYPTAASAAAVSSQEVRSSVTKSSSPFTGTAYEARVSIGLATLKFMFKPAYGEGGSAPAQPTEPQDIPEATEVPTGNDRFSFLDLYSDIADVHVGENAPVTFFAEMMSEYLINDTVDLVSVNDGSVLGQLRDDGVAPDETANDGLFSGTFNLSSDQRKNVTYRASCANVFSQPVDICYFNDLTQSDFNTVNEIFASVQNMNDIGAVSDFLEENAEIEYSIEDEAAGTVTFTTNAGITCVWESARPGGARSAGLPKAGSIDAAVIHHASMLAQNDPVNVANNKDIAIIRPFRSTQFMNDDFLDCANGITEALGGTVTCYDDGAATIEAMKELDRYGIVMFDTHGTFVPRTDSAGRVVGNDPYILIGEQITDVQNSRYFSDLQSGRIIVLNDGTVAIGHKFFDRYYADGAFDDTVFFVAACYYSIEDSISETLVRKGASVVFGFSDVAYVSYTNGCLDEIMLQSMALNASTAGQAFDNAVARYGSTDPQNPSDRLTVYGDTNYRIAVNNGYIAGVVTSSTTGEPIKRAFVQVYDADGNLVKELRTDPLLGVFGVKLPEGVYTVKVSAYGYLMRTVENVIVTSGNITFLSDSVMLYPEDEPVAGGYVINTFTGEYVPGAVIKFRSGHGSKTGDYVQADGAVLELVSDENGEFYTDKLKAGYYTAEVVCDDYITAYVDIVSAKEAVDQALPLTPTIAADQIRIVLTWGEYPYDLDSHLIGPGASGSGRFHTAYYDKTYSYNGTRYADLDRDDTDSYGPEQTTVYKKSSGTYSYYVHDYTNRGSSDSNAMARSGAKVVVYVGDSRREFNVPSTADGTLWHVFDFNFDTGTLTPVNTMSYQRDPESVGR